MEKLRSCYRDIVNSLTQTEQIADQLLSRSYLSPPVRGQIQTTQTIFKKNELLVDEILTGSSFGFDYFLELLKSTNQNHIYELLTNTEYNLTSEHVAIIQRNYPTLVDNMGDLPSLLDYLSSKEVISHQEEEEIRCASNRSSYDAIRHLLLLIQMKSTDAYVYFVGALIETKQIHLVKALLCPGQELAAAKERSQTGKSLVILGLVDSGRSATDETVYSVDLDRPDSVSKIGACPQNADGNAVMCELEGKLYAVGLRGPRFNQLWVLDKDRKLTKRANMPSGRRGHCLGVYGHVIYVFGGRFDSEPVDDVICYNSVTDKWSAAGKLSQFVAQSSCVTYKDAVYLFGGSDKKYEDVADVQRYTPADNKCEIVTEMPKANCSIRAVLWQDSAILLEFFTCRVYNFTTQTWLERPQYKAQARYFGVALCSGVVYVVGGGQFEQYRGGWKCRDDVRAVLAQDIVDDKAAEWQEHATLPQPAFIKACGVI